MSLILEKLLAPAQALPERPLKGYAGARLNISVVFTTVEATLAALRKAGTLAGRLRARITILVPQIVPYPLPLTSPPVLLDFNERRFRLIAEQTPVETTVRLYLCRDRRDMLKGALQPNSVVVLGGPKRWWPTSEKRLARALRHAGHEVVFEELP
jgi:hypothetical protein